MKIYIAHSKKSEYKSELYAPIRKSVFFAQHEAVLPHEFSEEPFPSKEFLRSCDAMIAETSFAGTGLGIEIGWADAFGVPVIAIRKKEAKPSQSVEVVASSVIVYESAEDMVAQLEAAIRALEKPSR